jgi:hypothetical protein
MDGTLVKKFRLQDTHVQNNDKIIDAGPHTDSNSSRQEILKTALADWSMYWYRLRLRSYRS